MPPMPSGKGSIWKTAPDARLTGDGSPVAGLALALALIAGPAAGRDLAAGLAACRDMAGDAARLACYDRMASAGRMLEFAGKGSRITPPFQLAQPALMTFTNEDVVMVIYLLDAEGNVVQNFHQPGAGQGSFLIRQAGTYSLQVNATGGWRIEVARP